MTTKDYSGRN